jgi:hypothetical protein
MSERNQVVAELVFGPNALTATRRRFPNPLGDLTRRLEGRS